MARLICPLGGENLTVDYCRTHDVDAVTAPDDPARTTVEPRNQPADDARPAAGEGPGSSAAEATPRKLWARPAICWCCGEPVADTRNARCTRCHESLEPPALILRFDGTTRAVGIKAGEAAILGRDPKQSPHSTIFAALAGVSRLHATAGADENGQPWIRDERSANGTFVNGHEIADNPATPLKPGDVIRLATEHSISATVSTAASVRETPGPDHAPPADGGAEEPRGVAND
jgi:hypothetical protein